MKKTGIVACALWACGLGTSCTAQVNGNGVGGDTTVASSAGPPEGDTGQDDDGPGPDDDDAGEAAGDSQSGPGPETGDGDAEGSTDAGDGGAFDPAPSGCVTDIASGLHNFDCDGLETTVMIPPACVDAPCGVVLDIHGASMSAQQEDNNTNLRALGADAGYIVVQPTTDGFTWMAGHQNRIMTGLFDVMEALDVDTDRIHLTGFSAGGGAAWIVVCEYSDVFASAAPAAATGQYLGSAPVCFGTNPPEHELDLLYMNGELDPFESMEYVGQLRDKIVSDWSLGAGVVIDGDGTFERMRYENAAGTAFELLTHTYQTDQVVSLGPLFNQPLDGHCYPGSTDHEPTEPGQIAGYGCKGANAFHWGETALQFFIENPK